MSGRGAVVRVTRVADTNTGYLNWLRDVYDLPAAEDNLPVFRGWGLCAEPIVVFFHADGSAWGGPDIGTPGPPMIDEYEWEPGDLDPTKYVIEIKAGLSLF